VLLSIVSAPLLEMPSPPVAQPKNMQLLVETLLLLMVLAIILSVPELEPD
jgi:hypothetical protein